MVTFANDINGNPPLYYLPVTLTNSQATATSSGFQQQLSINSTTFSTYEAANLQNINFQDGAGNIIKSIGEVSNVSTLTNTSTTSIYWVVPNAVIPGSGGTFTAYVVFYATTAFSKDATTTGMSTSWVGGTYGQYDNGVNIFGKYYNFAGTSIPSDMQTVGSTTATFSNGVSISGSGGGLSTSSTINPQTMITEVYSANLSGSGESGISQGIHIADDYQGGCVRWDLNAGVGVYFFLQADNSSFVVSTTAGVAYHVLSLTETTAAVYGSTDYSTWINTSSGFTPETAKYIFLFANGGSQTVGWLRTRLQPPSNVMPSATFGSINPVPSPSTANNNWF